MFKTCYKKKLIIIGVRVDCQQCSYFFCKSVNEMVKYPINLGGKHPGLLYWYLSVIWNLKSIKLLL